MPLPPFAADTGFTFAGPWALGTFFLGLAVFAAVNALSHEHERAFSASLIYLGLGLVAAVALNVLGVAWVDPVADAKLLEHFTEFAVIVALFAAGLKLDRALTWRTWGTVVRLLAVTMPLTIGLVVAFGTAVLGLSLGAAIVLGAALAPTDPVLAGDVGVGPPGDEDEHEPNFALTAEAGLNDGLAFPFVLLGLLVASGDFGVEWVLADLLYAVVAAVAAGAVVGYAYAWSVVRLRDAELLRPELDGWLAVAATLSIYGATEVIGAYGFLAVFVGGLAFRRYEREHVLNRRLHDGSEMVEKFGELAVILLLGSILTVDGLTAPGVAGWGLAFLMVFLVRPVAANVGLLGSRLDRPGERAYVAWFGVRGVGTLFYVGTAVASGALSDGDEVVVVWTAIACVIVSIVLHGVTAGPLRRFLAEQLRTEPVPAPTRLRRAPAPVRERPASLR
ncbi:MAG TPA: cation:proton antiporter [Solirubrobacteraceae bacterium]